MSSLGPQPISTLIVSKLDSKVYFIHNNKIIKEAPLSTLKITLNGIEVRNVNVMQIAQTSPFDKYDFMVD